MIHYLLFGFGLFSIFFMDKKNRFIVFFPIQLIFDIISPFYDYNTTNLRYIYAAIYIFSYMDIGLLLKRNKLLLILITYFLIIFAFYYFSEYFKPVQFASLFMVIIIPFNYYVGLKYADFILDEITIFKMLVIYLTLVYLFIVLAQFVSLPTTYFFEGYSTFFKVYHFDYGIYAVAFANLLLLKFYFEENIVFRKHKTFLIIFWVSSFILVIIFMKRTAIIDLLFGYVFFFYYLWSFKRATIIKMMSLIILAVIIGGVFLGGIFLKQYEAREDSLKGRDLEIEGRYIDYFLVFENFYNIKTERIFFGDEYLFDSTTLWRKYFQTPRVVHSDIAYIAYTTGLVGLFLYLLFFSKIFISVIKSNINKRNLNYNLLFSKVLIVILAINLTGGGTFREFTAASLGFFLIGYYFRKQPEKNG